MTISGYCMFPLISLTLPSKVSWSLAQDTSYYLRLLCMADCYVNDACVLVYVFIIMHCMHVQKSVDIWNQFLRRIFHIHRDRVCV